MSKHTERIVFFIRQKLQLPALYVRAAALLLLALLLLRHRTAAAAGVVSGIHTCLGTLIPSLFPFILLACLCTNSRAAQVLFRRKFTLSDDHAAEISAQLHGKKEGV